MLRSRRSNGRQPPGSARWKGDVAFVAAVAALAGLLILYLFPELLHGRLIDTDSYMRLVRVRRLAGSGGWFDGSIPRSNAPFGETLHWTRPLDVLILAGAWVAEPFLGFRQALHMSGVLVAPLLLIVVCLTTAWAVQPLAGRGMRYYAMLAVLAQAGIMGYALPGRADQNMLILLAFVATLGSAFRMFLQKDAHRSAWATGAWAGFGLWVSTEFVVALFVVLSSLLGLWIRDGKLASRARTMAMALLGVIIVAVVLEHPPGELLTVEYDRISIVYVWAAALNAAFWLGVGLPAMRPVGRTGRAWSGLFGTVVAVGLLLAVYPGLVGGPMVEVSPELKRAWLASLTEFQPFLVPTGLSGIGRSIAYLGHAFLAAGVVVHGIRRHWNSERSGAWILLGVALIVFTPLAIRWVRFAMYAEILGVVGTIVLLDHLLLWVDDRYAGARRSVTRALVTAGILTGPLLVGAGMTALGGEHGGAARQPGTTVFESCPVEELVATLNDPSSLGDRPRTVFAHVDLGPVLLYRTPHSVVATPYHRNERGILDWLEVMATRDLDRARRVIRERDVDLVVTCGLDPTLADQSSVEEPTFAARLQAGTVPDWLTLRPASNRTSGLAIYEVVAEQRQ